MNRFIAFMFFLFALVFSNHTIANDSYYLVTEADKKFLTEIVNAVQKGNTSWIANQMLYPLSIIVSNKTQMVYTKEEFKPILDREFSQETRTNLIDDARQPLFKNWSGTMIGNGIVWFSEFGEPEKDSYYKIDAIGDFAFQPSEIIGTTPSGH